MSYANWDQIDRTEETADLIDEIGANEDLISQGFYDEAYEGEEDEYWDYDGEESFDFYPEQEEYEPNPYDGTYSEE